MLCAQCSVKANARGVCKPAGMLPRMFVNGAAFTSIMILIDCVCGVCELVGSVRV